MSAAAAVHPLLRRFRFYDTTNGKKAVMAVTGIVLFGFVVGHLIGNLQVFAGSPDKINNYAAALRSVPALLWGARLTLLLAVGLHIVATIQFIGLKNKARPVAYVKKDAIASSYASRTMYWSGPIVAFFVLYHLMHLTWGVVHPDFRHNGPIPDAYGNIVSGFSQWPVSLFYIVAVSLLGLHLYHGLFSLFQTLGAAHPRYTPLYKKFAVIASLLITLGYISIPLAVLTGLIGNHGTPV